MMQNTLPDHVKYLLNSQRSLVATEAVQFMEHGGLYGVIRSAWINQGGTYIVTMWQWNQGRFDRALDATGTLRGDWGDAEWRKQCFYYGWHQIGTSRCFDSRHSAESALLDMLEYPAFTMLKFG